MVKLDNWQTKAEKAAERRVAGKERKKQRGRTRSNKALSQKLIALLDQHNDRILLSAIAPDIHVWVDTAPSHYATIAEEEEEDIAVSFKSPEKKKKGRPRSNSLMEAALASSPTSGGFGGSKKGRARSNSESGAPSALGSGGKKQNGRPRSNSNASQHQDDLEQAAPKMPCQAFFGERNDDPSINNGGRNCKLWRKASSGSLCGSTIKNRTLCDVLLESSHKNLLGGENREVQVKESLRASQKAAEAYFEEEDGVTSGNQIMMDVVYHVPIAMPPNEEDGDGSDDTSLSPISISETVLTTLAEKSCCLGSIVYLSLSGILVFDRYRDGVVLTAGEEHALFYGNDGSKRRSVSIGDYHDTGGAVELGAVENIRNHHQNLVMYLPSQVLEYVLTFLPDSATALAPLVCRSWSNEIGRTSQNLWKQLLKRNKWPMPPPVSGQSTVDARNVYRDAFVSHYTALRDTKAIATGLYQVMEQLGIPRAGTSPLSGSSMKDVAVSQSQNVYSSNPPIVRIWSPARALLANRDVCTLSLVDVVATSSAPRCRQSVCVTVEPFRSSRRRDCSLVAMDLDDRLIGCLFKVWTHGTSEEFPTPWLGIADRDSLLCSGGIDRLEEGVVFENLREKVLDFILTRHGVEQLGWPFDFLDEFSIASLDVIIRESIVACGNGHFLFEAVVTFPPTFCNESDAHDAHVTRLAMFSAFTREVSWIGPTGDVEVSAEIMPRPLASTMVACAPDAGTRGGNQPTRVAFVSDDHSKQISTVNVFKNGFAKDAEKRGNSQILADKISIDHPTWRHSPSVGGLALVTNTDVIFVNCYTDSAENNAWKSVLTFHSTWDDTKVDFATIMGLCRHRKTICLRCDHMLVLVEQRDVTVGEKLYAVLIHIPSRQELYRIHLGDSTACTLTYSLAALGNTLAVATDLGGMLLAGRELSSLTSSQGSQRENDGDGMNSAKKKKSSRKKRAGGGKKDGFARGMMRSLG